MAKKLQRKLIEMNGFVVFLFLINACTNNKAESNIFQQNDINQQDIHILSIKAKKELSAFGDTLILDRYKDEIVAFEIDDSLNPSRKTDIVFTGSSSIRKWTSLRDDMNGLKVLNRGFGGSTIPEVIYYADELIFKHNPKQIVFYAGENDIATTKTDSMKVFESFVYFQKLVKQRLPNTQIYFISIKLSPSRSQFWNTIKSTNTMIKKYCSSVDNCTFIDVNKYMLDKNNQVRTDLYVIDQLHLNTIGYQIWTKVIYRAIKKQNK